jgi:hypothetical protein
MAKPLHPRHQRKANLPPHCGTCIFHEWDEDRSTCVHPSIVDPDDLAQAAADANADILEGAISCLAIAEHLMEDAICDQEWHPYDHVCEHYRAHEHTTYPNRAHEASRVRHSAVDEFATLIETLAFPPATPTGATP